MTSLTKAGAAPEPEKMLQVPDQTDHLAKEVETLHASIDTLIPRLASILKPSKTPVDDPEKELQELVPLAGAIRGSVLSVKNARIKVEDILERLEL